MSCKLETYPDQKGSRGYAYVQYKTEEEADAAIAALNNTMLGTKTLEVKKHTKKDKTKTDASSATGSVAKLSNNLFVKYLPTGTDDEGLTALFSQFGPIESVKVQRDE